jgi:hypothetical protein
VIVTIGGLVVLALCAAALIDEFRHGGSLSLLKPARDDEDVLELPIPDGWCQHDVLVTLAEIASL